MKKTAPPFLIIVSLVCFAALPGVHAVVPAPDGGYPGANTAEGQAALLALSSGTYNTGVGYFSLLNNTSASFNTALGAATLASNTTGQQNTATGAGTLLSNTTGEFNTANGALALLSNITGIKNVAVGSSALTANLGASFNTAIGSDALIANTVGQENTAIGSTALSSNTGGFDNVGVGVAALNNNTTGSNNVALGLSAGFFQTTGSNNVYIGGGQSGVAGENNTIHIADSPNPGAAATACYIAGIFGQTSANGVQLLISSDNKLGTMTSSKRFKQDIKPMDKASETLLALKPVVFRYKKEIDPAGRSQFGLVAEDVERTNPDLVVRDNDGKPYSVRYDQVNAMLLNEFLKEHKAFVEEQGKVQEQGATIARLAQQVAELTAGLQKVNAQLAAASPSGGGLEASKPAPQVVNNP
jgi:Chaperone of endosialidase